ncbi:M12 family metallo-peptidase [Paenibacillus sp. S150]|uniref:M12 family metallo-peptidase n=1 Tax=Paenibacillus sp. S150 TaxID=2749826 RepID=UPI001C584DC6|nr:M12 family metallo-peptidase [Paenibacillus sp. S150]MBW4085379.1 peptidase M84 [Paenibacillus sp. S150]
MLKLPKFSFAFSIVLICSLPFVPLGSAEDVNKVDVNLFYQNHAKIAGDTPAEPSQNKFREEVLTPNIERSVAIPVYDESGNLVNEFQLNKNVDVETKASVLETGKLVNVLVAVDEEYRSAHSDWQTRVSGIVESADDAFNQEFSIDLNITAYRYWFSDGNSATALLSNLAGDATDTYDLVIGFTGESDFNGADGGFLGGIAYQYDSNPFYAGYSVVSDQSLSGTAHAVQHEVSHNYGLGHDTTGTTPVCIMNYGTMYSTTVWHSTHHDQLGTHKLWYGTTVS